MEEKKANRIYQSLLSYFESRLGTGVTNNRQLDREAKRLFEPYEWHGVFAANQNWKQHIGKGYCIVNLDPIGSPGSHWVGIAGNLLYDSFGRANILGAIKNLEDTDRDPEQEKREDNCGQRVLAFLVIYKIYGHDVAKLL